MNKDKKKMENQKHFKNMKIGFVSEITFEAAEELQSPGLLTCLILWEFTGNTELFFSKPYILPCG